MQEYYCTIPGAGSINSISKSGLALIQVLVWYCTDLGAGLVLRATECLILSPGVLALSHSVFSGSISVIISTLVGRNAHLLANTAPRACRTCATILQFCQYFARNIFHQYLEISVA